MELYRSKDGHVAKYVHDDGSETAIKTTPIEEFGGVYGKVTNKYNVFISYGVGCIVGCKFCYLTTKQCPHADLTVEEIINNVTEAIRIEIGHKPKLKGMYTKLSWMGMSDAYIDTSKMYEATIGICGILEKEGLSAGIDGVDISTTLPKIPTPGADYVSTLACSINGFRLNPERAYYDPATRHPIRVFYSLHSAVETTRRFLIPKTVKIKPALDYFKQLVKQGNTTLVLHHMFFANLNDSKSEVDEVISLLENFNNVELRLLRFNKCEGTTFIESGHFDEIVERIYSNHTNIKVQSSPGAEVSAACGQFLLSKIDKKIIIED